nr:histidine phosphotransferase family protein [uncultured Rhodopila sp.]
MSGRQDALYGIELAAARLWTDIRPFVGATGAAGEDGVLAARLRLRHAAWTPAAGPLPLRDLEALARGLPDRVGIDTAPLDSRAVFAPAAGRIALNLLLLAADSLPAGGIVLLAGAADDLFVRIAGPAAAWPPGLALCLADAEAARAALTEPAVMQMAVTALLAHAAGCRLSVLMSPRPGAEPPMLRLGG